VLESHAGRSKPLQSCNQAHFFLAWYFRGGGKRGGFVAGGEGEGGEAFGVGPILRLSWGGDDDRAGKWG
jgi:hypothetical protein